MDRRTWYSVSTAFVLLIGLTLLSVLSRPGIVLGQVAQKMEEIKSFSALIEILKENEETRNTPKGVEGDSQEMNDTIGKIIWSASGDFREETYPKPLLVGIMTAKGKGLSIDHRSKIVEEIPAKDVESSRKLANSFFHNLMEFKDSERKPIAIDEVEGLKCPRFDLFQKDFKTHNPQWDYRIWVHPETKRPIRVDFKADPADPFGTDQRTIRMTNFSWNVATDSTFDTTIPNGYRLKEADNSYDWVAEQIIGSLKAYAELYGTYPKVSRFDNQLLADFETKLRNAKNGEAINLLPGFMLLQNTVTSSPDYRASYRGQIVGPKDKEKILLHWIQPDGKVRVIFGDLKSKLTTADESKALEK
ncbi:hypothetical protein KIH39_25110 [Telmatocola sphagniphila]|uniref:Uncharacterized protein n=1 Tax=Telmatocola sphagniphila TaxID=1123043 RepID=A0A8E6EV34_9BACT|nr:hypothetical protein [Telmatocola sphagniphila]QVL32077.1 hypothetical protein KIH39_25110 [Telmatocola sphagniphila]